MIAYLSGPWAGREQLRHYRAELTQVGYTVRASWLDEADGYDPARAAGDNLLDVRRADLFVGFTPHALGLDHQDAAHHTGGRHIETGYAIARYTPVVLIGQPENIFHRLPTVTVIADWHTAILYLSRVLLDWNHTQQQNCQSEPLRAQVQS